MASDTASTSRDSNMGSSQDPLSIPDDIDALFDKHMSLITRKPDADDLDEITTAPLFTGSVRTQLRSSIRGSIPAETLTQYGLLGGNTEEMLGSKGSDKADPRIFHNVTAPASTFICGSQGSGKSHTLSCLLENCLIPSAAGLLPKPLTGVVFHFDTFSSDADGSPCEAAYLSSNPHVRVRVLCAPTNVRTIKATYSKLPNVSVEELLINASDLNTARMLDLMAVGAGEMPLYLHVVKRVVRDMRIEQQRDNTPFSYHLFKARIAAERLTPGQMAPLQQRLDTLESFMPRYQTTGQAALRKKALKEAMTMAAIGTNWTAKAGQLTIVDLSCPCVTPEMACSLFNICLSLFLEQNSSIGRVVALDEAHKYMNESPESMVLTKCLEETIRLQRHLGARVVISTQEPSISPKLLDLCSVAIVHRFSSPDWLRTLKEHLAGVSSASRLLQKALIPTQDCIDIHTVSVDPADPLMDLFSTIVNLRVGEALVFAPSAIVGCHRTEAGEARRRVVRLGAGIMKVQIRTRVTEDGGRSILAN